MHAWELRAFSLKGCYILSIYIFYLVSQSGHAKPNETFFNQLPTLTGMLFSLWVLSASVHLAGGEVNLLYGGGACACLGPCTGPFASTHWHNIKVRWWGQQSQWACSSPPWPACERQDLWWSWVELWKFSNHLLRWHHEFSHGRRDMLVKFPLFAAL